ncbi:MAG: YbjN domain-containing protein [Magnetococcales bacterium]|nr:YbjN domain-containing protein [Magnetococcales bacterium]
MSQTTRRPTPENPEEPTINPIGMVEEYVIDQDWHAERIDEFELWAEIPTQWGNFRLWTTYHENTGFLQFNCYLTLKIPPRLWGRTAETMALINERIWVGHFEVWNEEMTPVLRVVLPMRGAPLSEEQVEDILTSIHQDADRFFPALQWVIWGGKKPEEAVATAMIETEGEA